MIPNTIQPRDRHESSVGGGTDGISYNCYVIFNRWNDERNVNVASYTGMLSYGNTWRPQEEIKGIDFKVKR